jgi:tRNA U34 5-carboxymethylaminomethyl modifying enzyme MnmG/GidA
MPKQETATAQSRTAERGFKVHPLVEVQQAHQQAYWNWLREVQLAFADIQAQAQKGQAEFAQNLQEQFRSAGDYNQYVEAYRNAAKKLQESSSGDDLGKRLLEAHRNYLRAIREAWSQLDPDAITFDQQT